MRIIVNCDCKYSTVFIDYPHIFIESNIIVQITRAFAQLRANLCELMNIVEGTQ